MAKDCAELIQVARKLAEQVAVLTFSEPVAYCYNPLEYAWKPFEKYLRLYAAAPKEVLLVGMNPGPFGMAQTGIPFGAIAMVRDWLKIEECVEKPAAEHPKRLVQGFACAREEVSGTRVWGWAKDRFQTPHKFFSRFFVWSYCPLCFLESSSRNRTPDKLPAQERKALFGPCDEALKKVYDILQPTFVVGFGRFAETRVKTVLEGTQAQCAGVLHPSPANPQANRGWSEKFEQELSELGIQID